MTKQHTTGNHTSEQEFEEHLDKNLMIESFDNGICRLGTLIPPDKSKLLQAHREAVQAAEVALLQGLIHWSDPAGHTHTGLTVDDETIAKRVYAELAARSHNGGKHE